MELPSDAEVFTQYKNIERRLFYLSIFYAFKVGEKWTTVLPSKIDVDFFYCVRSAARRSRCERM